MRAFPILSFFRLTDEGVRCDEDGLFVGSVPMLLHSPRSGGAGSWAARPAEELDRDLSDLYGLPIDIAAKREGLAGVAWTLESGDLALAKIAALLLRLPDPPSLAKGAPMRGAPELAVQLFGSGLLKGGWDPAKHPRTGEAPNRGWFAPTESSPEPEGDPERRRQGEKLLRPLRDVLKVIAEGILRTRLLVVWTRLAIAAEDVADEEITSLKIEALVAETLIVIIRGRQQAAEQARTALDPPKTRVELQTPPTENVGGYEVHHIVEQNPANLAKSPCEIQIEKFGRNLIDSPSNLVWIPRLKHELITGYYNSLDDGDPGGRIHRRVVNEGDFAAQREAGLQALRLFGVLK